LSLRAQPSATFLCTLTPLANNETDSDRYDLSHATDDRRQNRSDIQMVEKLRTSATKASFSSSLPVQSTQRAGITADFGSLGVSNHAGAHSVGSAGSLAFAQRQRGVHHPHRLSAAPAAVQTQRWQTSSFLSASGIPRHTYRTTSSGTRR